jgi:type I restriction enzyme S subunit
MKRIGDILTRNKTRVTVEDGTSYKQVTIRTNYKGVVLRGVQDGSTIGTKEQFRVSAGQFILSRIDARNGAFGIIPDELEGAIVTNDFLAFDINDSEVETEFFNVFLQSPIFLEACIKASRGNTNRKRVDEDFFLGYEVNLPSLPEQHQLIRRINKARAGIETAQHEITRQQSLLAKLKQAILQEAIQGKLTVDWRAANQDVEPASQLLQRIQAEKAHLAAAKKLRSEKPLYKITVAEIPFEIPKRWGWYRLGGIIDQTESGWSPACLKHAASPEKWGVLKTTAVQCRQYVADENKELPSMLSPRPEHEAKVGDILMTRAGPANRVGICALIRETRPKLIISDKIIRFRPVLLNAEYLELFANTPQFQNLIEASKQGMAQSQVNISQENLKLTVVPIPPLAEQKAIVEKVEALMTTCRVLEAEIEHTRTHAANLLQAVLREAFSGEPAVQDKNDKPAPAKSNVIPFPARIGNISPTDLHAGILAMAYQYHETPPKYLAYFGHVKAEKIAHLVEAYLGIDLERDPVKAAAGPNDYPHLKKVESRAAKANWFIVRQQKVGGAYVFHKKNGFDALLSKTVKALGERATEVDALINLMLPLNTRQAEIVATLYAAWNNLLLLGLTPSDEDIVYEARENWHDSKRGIEREKFFKGLEWMRKHGLVPTGRGRYVGAK